MQCANSKVTLHEKPVWPMHYSLYFTTGCWPGTFHCRKGSTWKNSYYLFQIALNSKYYRYIYHLQLISSSHVFLVLVLNYYYLYHLWDGSHNLTLLPAKYEVGFSYLFLRRRNSFIKPITIKFSNLKVGLLSLSILII